MYAALYLKRSFSRRFQKHFSLYLVLTFAFLLPLLVSFYRDSRAYGEIQQLLFLSKGQTFHIANVTEETASIFKESMAFPLRIMKTGKSISKLKMTRNGRILAR